MGMKSTVVKQAVVKDGYFDYPAMYAFAQNWFSSEGYDMVEGDYSEKEKATGKEILMHWAPERKITDYFKFVINVEIFIRHLNEAEIERDGKKVKTYKGLLRVKIRAEVVKDYEERWEQKPSTKFFRGLYEKFIIKNTVDEYEDRIGEDALNFAKELKAFLDLEG